MSDLTNDLKMSNIFEDFKALIREAGYAAVKAKANYGADEGYSRAVTVFDNAVKLARLLFPHMHEELERHIQDTYNPRVMEIMTIDKPTEPIVFRPRNISLPYN